LKVKLESLLDTSFQNGYAIEHLFKGDVVDADFSQFGVRLLFRDTWTLHYDYRKIEEYFKVHGQ